MGDRAAQVWDALEAAIEAGAGSAAAVAADLYLATPGVLALGPDGWAALDEALAAADQGDFEPLQELVGLLADAGEDSGSTIAVACADDLERLTLEDVLAEDRELRVVHPRSVLLTHQGDGHTAAQAGRRCIDDIVAAYLLELRVPSDRTSCPAE